MLKPNANFKLDRQSKRFLACIPDPHRRAAVKKIFIQGILQSQIQPRREKKQDFNNAGE